MSLLVSETYFWPAETGKNLNIFRCVQVLKLVLKLFSDKRKNLDTLLFSYIELVNIGARLFGLNFFICRLGFKLEIFAYCTFTETFAIGLQIRFDDELIDFRDFVGICLVSSLYNQRRLKFATNAKIRFLLTTSINSDSLFEGILWCSLNLPLLLSHTIL